MKLLQRDRYRMYDMDQVTAGNTLLGVFCQFTLLVGKEFALRNLGDIEHDFLATAKINLFHPNADKYYVSTCMCIYRIYLSVCLSIHPSIYPSIHKNRVYIYMYTYLSSLCIQYVYIVCIHSMYTYIQHAGVSACMHVCLNVCKTNDTDPRPKWSHCRDEIPY